MSTENHYLPVGTIFEAGADSVKLYCELSVNFMAHSAVDVWGHPLIERWNTNSRKLQLKSCLRVDSHNPNFDLNYMLCIVSQIWLVSCFAVLIEIAGKKVKYRAEKWNSGKNLK